jgi:hypothetical protein
MSSDVVDPIRFAYFDWLYHQSFEVNDIRSPKSYFFLCSALHEVIFKPLIPNDDNRAADGINLREAFARSLRTPSNRAIMNNLLSMGDATIFEMMTALAKRADYIVSYGPEDWFMRFLINLNINRSSDPRWSPTFERKTAAILEVLNERRYAPNGKGGLFPLDRPRRDQREVEIWYQMQAFIEENCVE